MKPKNKDSESPIWKILSSQVRYEYQPFLRVDKQRVQLPDGRVIGDYHQVKMPEYCLICPLTSERKLVTLHGYRHGVRRVTSFLPGGLIDSDETPVESAKRELLEETGYMSEKWVSLGSDTPHSNYGCGRVHIFKAMDVSQITNPDSGDLENMDIRIVDSKTIKKWIESGNIDSISSVAAITLGLGDIF